MGVDEHIADGSCENSYDIVMVVQLEHRDLREILVLNQSIAVESSGHKKQQSHKGTDKYWCGVIIDELAVESVFSDDAHDQTIICHQKYT